ncbi:unnamed protein product, partial [Polarella glacialis]
VIRQPEIRIRQNPGVQHNPLEDLEWVNYGLTCLWPSFDLLAKFFAEEVVTPRLKAVLPKEIGAGFRFSQFTLGKTPVVVGPVQVSRYTTGSVRLKVCVEYESDVFFEVSVDTPLGPVAVGMKDFKLSGDIVVRIRPYISTAPGVG